MLKNILLYLYEHFESQISDLKKQLEENSQNKDLMEELEEKAQKLDEVSEKIFNFYFLLFLINTIVFLFLAIVIFNPPGSQDCFFYCRI
jgi:hypothetical protein